MLDREHLANVARQGPPPVFATISGAHLYGFASPDSDVDLRGAFVRPAREMLGLHPPSETLTIEDKTRIDLDWVAHDVRKFARLMTNHNGYVLEQLYSPLVVVSSPAHEELRELGKGCVTRPTVRHYQGFARGRRRRLNEPAPTVKHLLYAYRVLGYAMAQLSKIQSHRSWLLHPPTKPPSREDFGLPRSSGTLSRDDQNRIEQSITDKLRSYGIDDLEMPKPTRVAVRERLASFYRDVLSAQGEVLHEHLRSTATSALRLPASVVSALDGEKRYRSAAKHWEAYQAWQTQRNPARAELEPQHGYDTKHAMHLIRLMRMGLEILETGEFSVRRADARELSAIRDGALSFEELLANANQLREAIDRAALTTRLPDDVDRAQTDELVVSLMLEASG